MTDDPKNQDFDWVSARHKCSLPHEFVRLKTAVQANCAARQRCLPKDTPVGFRFEDLGTEEFSVTRHPVGGAVGLEYAVTFSLRNDHISVIDCWSDPAHRFSLTVELNDDGECRFVIDGEGEYLRWQVARRALCPMFFQAPSERVVP